MVYSNTPRGPWSAACDAITEENPSAVNFVDGEVPSATGDPSVFTLANVPNPPSSLHLFLGGLRQSRPGDFSLSGNSITFVQVPGAGDAVVADYRY